MNEKSGKLGIGEFLSDIRYVIATPAARFPVILERRALWGSVLLLVVPAYFAFSFSGGVFFDRDPFPGYSFLIPALLAAITQFTKAFFIHFFGRLFEGKWHYSAATGKFRDMMTVFGYSMVPGGLAVILATILLLLVPAQIGAALRYYRAISLSLLIALGVGFFVWNLILLVLALRPIFPMRDYKIVAAFFLGHVLAAVPAAATALVALQVEVQLAYLQPILSPRMLEFMSAGSGKGTPREDKVSIHADRVVYRYKRPEHFDLVAYDPAQAKPVEESHKGGAMVYGKVSMFSMEGKDQVVGRVIGLPGDTVELVQGGLRINERLWAEPYIPAECRSNASLPPKHLGPSEYLILPEDRHLLDSKVDDWVVERNRITGRILVVKWPLGWAIFRPTAFLPAVPQNE